MPYQVAWARCNVFTDAGEPTLLSRGEYVPDDIDHVQVSQLATIGAVRFVDLAVPVLAEVAALTVTAPVASDFEFEGDPDAPPVGFVDTSLGVPSGSPLSAPGPDDVPLLPRGPEAGPEAPTGEDAKGAPAKSATKPEWEEYAVAQGMPREEAEAATKAELIAKFGG